MSSRARKVKEAAAVKARIREVDFFGFQDQGRSQTFPFPGFGTTVVGRRPPREFQFVGRVEYREVMRRVLEETDPVRNRGLLITGPSGSGKSCILRAVAVELIGRSAATEKVICNWFFDANQNMVKQVQDSLLFTFSDAGDAVLNKIEGIRTAEALSEFLKGRRLDGDFLVFVSDGDENYDAQHKDGTPRKDEETRSRYIARSWLEAFERNCDFIVKTLSPGANEATEVPMLMQKYEIETSFGKGEYASFLKNDVPILGAMLARHPERKDDVALFAGQHPMSLYFLGKACDEYVRNITGPPSRKRRASFGLLDPRTGAEVEYQQPLQVEHPEDFLDDDHVWEEVLARFQEGEPFSEIREYVKSYEGSDEDLRSPASVFTRFVGKNEVFCTDFIYAVHLEAALERLKGTVFRSEAFRAYVKMKIEKGDIIWPKTGWACEAFVADAIMAMGLPFQGRTVRPSELKRLKGEPEKLNQKQWQPGVPVYLKPGKYSFKYVDGIIAWMDDKGVLHFLALQVTVSPETHTKTEYEFMQKAEAERWYTGPCEWHYIYLCPEKDTARASAAGARKEPIGLETAELVEYEKHYLKFSECFESVGLLELHLLQLLAEAREQEMKRREKAKAQQSSTYRQLLRSLPAAKQELLKRAEIQKVSKARPWLEDVATKCGVSNPSNKVYRSIYQLLSAMDDQACVKYLKALKESPS